VTQHNWIYFDAARRPSTATWFDPYDDVWRGGFEELFPNDAPGDFGGRQLPDHGELWNAPFELVQSTRDAVTLRRECTWVPATFEKHVAISPTNSEVNIEYRISNRSPDPLWYLFKLHPALRLEPGDRLLLPGGTITAVTPEFGTRFGGGHATWPHAQDRLGRRIDLSRVPPPEDQSREFIYVADLPDGWCGLERTATGERIVFTFSRDLFPYCWLFLSFGGWKDYYTAVLEPCTNMPKDLRAAKAAGRCAVLGGSETRVYHVTIRVTGVRG
jgi:hypothetical protein